MIDVIPIHSENPNKREISRIADRLRMGEIMIFPTDTVYALGCLAGNKKGLERIIKITGKKEKQTNLSLICKDLSMASQYTLPINGTTFKAMKRSLPGPFVFILRANKIVQKYFKGNKKEIGIRIPENTIIESLLDELDNPLISTSLNKEDLTQPYFIDPHDIARQYEHTVDILIDGGIGDFNESTVVSFVDGTYEVIREGIGDINLL
ncbi:MAG: threonylcarbamoyl-AMP synthase [Bacteroidia bacterium]|nr:threonylcarbamoyl-AMP synthase [Bacteroidia bacterium]